ncbi:MAG: DinB family protein [Acidobacteria bacterium]|nr:DinB family protein [Acidobacteriota bacterium]MBS1866240.1 DinB family protein [Acidobacteriota bacterium]
MSTMSGDQATFLLGIFMGTIKQESVATKNVIAAIPADKGDYKPDDYSKTSLELARHIAAAEARLTSIPIEGKFDPSGPTPIPESVKTPAELAAWYEQSTADKLQKLKALTPEQLTKPVDFRGLFQLPAVMYLEFASNHSIHHRGQLSAYLRAMGGKVPAIYGESYDSAAAKKAAGG